MNPMLSLLAAFVLAVPHVLAQSLPDTLLQSVRARMNESSTARCAQTTSDLDLVHS